MGTIDSERVKYEDIYANERRYANTGHLYGTVGNGLDVLDTISTFNDVSSVIEVGCGYARVSCDVLARRLADTVTAVDLSSAVIRKLSTMPPRAGLTFVSAPAHELPFPDKSFDLALMFDVLEHIPEPLIADTLAEVTRVSRQGLICSVAWHEDIKFGHDLHITRKPEAWWMERFSAVAEVEKLCDKESGFYARLSWEGTGCQ